VLPRNDGQCEDWAPSILGGPFWGPGRLVGVMPPAPGPTGVGRQHLLGAQVSMAGLGGLNVGGNGRWPALTRWSPLIVLPDRLASP